MGPVIIVSLIMGVLRPVISSGTSRSTSATALARRTGFV
jgi:hypothetical protein